MKSFQLRLLLSLSLLVGAFSATPAKAGVDLLNFQVGLIGAFPSGGSSQYFAQAAWTPYIGAGMIGVRGDFGVTWLKNGIGDRFLAVNTEALLSLGFGPGFSLEAGGGLHNWIDNGGSDVAVSANAVFTAVPGIDRVFVGFSRFFLGSGVNEVRAGIGFNL
jgi:hypothetical protein